MAFAPAPSVRSRMATTMMAEKSRSIPILNKPKNLPGDGSLAGDEGFDPLGLSNIGDLGFDLYWMREAELKHARVAMLAFAGMIATETGTVVPGFVSLKNCFDLFCLYCWVEVMFCQCKSWNKVVKLACGCQR